MTLGQWQARLIVKSANIMAFFLETSPIDKVRWRPAVDEKSKTNSMMEQVAKCTYANVRFRHVFLGEEALPRPATWENNLSVEEAAAELKESAKLLAEVVEKLDAAGLAKEYMTHRGPMSGALAMQFPVRNMTYHMGQINMIQLLYGDTEFHINEEFLTL